MKIIDRGRFNNQLIRMFLCFTPPATISNFHDFDLNVKLAPKRANLQQNDVIQVTLRADRLQNDVSMIQRYGSGSLSEFQQLLDRLVQSNVSVFNDGSFELIVSLVRPNNICYKRHRELICCPVVGKWAINCQIHEVCPKCKLFVNNLKADHQQLTERQAQLLRLLSPRLMLLKVIVLAT